MKTTPKIDTLKELLEMWIANSHTFQNSIEIHDNNKVYTVIRNDLEIVKIKVYHHDGGTEEIHEF